MSLGYPDLEGELYTRIHELEGQLREKNAEIERLRTENQKFEKDAVFHRVKVLDLQEHGTKLDGLRAALTALRNLKRPFMVPSIRAIEIAEDAIRALIAAEEGE